MLRNFIIILTILFMSSVLYPQNSDIKFEHITVADGLPHNHIVSILQDNIGFIWFSTENGLVKYNGYTFFTYIPRPFNNKNIIC